MKLEIEITCDNAAFADDTGAEIERILQNVVEKIKRDGYHGGPYRLLDLNGNTAGRARFVD